MNVNWTSPKAVGKAILVFLALSAASSLALALVAAGIDTAAPGKGFGARLLSWVRI